MHHVACMDLFVTCVVNEAMSVRILKKIYSILFDLCAFFVALPDVS